MTTYRYGRWDDSQEPFPPSVDDLMDSLSDDLSKHGDVKTSLRRLNQKGFTTPDGSNVEGLKSMLEKLREKHKDIVDKYDLNSVMQGIREKLKEIKELEETTLESRLQEAKDAITSNATKEPTELGNDENPNSTDRSKENNKDQIESTEKELAEFLKELESQISEAHSENNDPNNMDSSTRTNQSSPSDSAENIDPL